MGTVEKLTLENMGVAFGILSLGGTETEIHLGVIYPPPHNCNVRFKKYHCNIRVKLRMQYQFHSLSGSLARKKRCFQSETLRIAKRSNWNRIIILERKYLSKFSDS